MRKPQVQNLLTAATATGAGDSYTPWGKDFTIQASGATSAGAGAATIVIQVSNDTSLAWQTMGTITLTLSTTASVDSFGSALPWKFVRANITAISGTDATVTVAMGNLSP